MNFLFPLMNILARKVRVVVVAAAAVAVDVNMIDL
jgi:hypothetical protein